MRSYEFQHVHHTLSFKTNHNVLDTRYIKMFVLDEADEMLSRGFKDQIYDVFRTLNENIQVCKALKALGHCTCYTGNGEMLKENLSHIQHCVP